MLPLSRKARVKRMQRKAAGFFSGVAVALLVVTSCSGSDPTPTPRPTSTPVATPTPQLPPTPDPSSPLSIVGAMLDALNSGNVVRASELLADDVTFDLGLGAPVEGAEGVAQTFGTLAGVGARLELSNPRVAGDTVSSEVTAQIPILGGTPPRGTVEIVVREGRVASFVVVFDEATRALLGPFFGGPS